MLSTLGLPSPRKNWLLRSVLTTSLSTTNCTLRQNARCSSGVMESLAQSGAPAGGQPAARALPSPHPTRKGTGCCRSDLGGGRPEVPLAQPRDQPGPGRPQLALGPWGPRATPAPGSVCGRVPSPGRRPQSAGPSLRSAGRAACRRCRLAPGRLPFLLDLRVFLPLLHAQRLALLRRGLVAVVAQQEGPDLPPD